MKPSLSLINALLVVLVMGGCSSKPATVGLNDAAMTRIPVGAPYEEVVTIFGQPGEKTAETIVPGNPTPAVIYTWVGADGFMVRAAFQDNKVVSIEKVAAAQGAGERMADVTSTLDTIAAAQESYFKGRNNYATVGAIDARFADLACALPANTSGIVAEIGDGAAMQQTLGVNLSEGPVTTRWKFATEALNGGQSWRIVAEGIAPETRNLAAYKQKDCPSTLTDTDASQ